jgi:hypothetical protein
MERVSTLSGSSAAIRRLVQRARQDPYFLGWTLSKYQYRHCLNDQQLAQRLECTLKALERLSICRLPDDLKEEFHQEVRQIAKFSPCNCDRLVQLLREVAAISVLADGFAENENGFLLAARHRKPHGDDNPPEAKGDKD